MAVFYGAFLKFFARIYIYFGGYSDYKGYNIIAQHLTTYKSGYKSVTNRYKLVANQFLGYKRLQNAYPYIFFLFN